MENIVFLPASLDYKDIIFKWLEEPHMIEFWDNSQEHKDDILNFMHSREQHYFAKTTKYWIGLIEQQPYSFILLDVILQTQENLPAIHRQYLSNSGNTIALDFGIGNTQYLGKGLAAPTLEAFVEFYYTQIDRKADTFFIDPDENNPRAQLVYNKAGFKKVGEFKVTKGEFKGSQNYLMVKKYE